jgi:excinuclease UvrABC helicase subunit UvrB
MLRKLLLQLTGTSGLIPRDAERLTIGGVPLARSQEPLHLLLAGSTGTGKTTAIAELLDGIAERGDRAVIVDPNGSYASQFYGKRLGVAP